MQNRLQLIKRIALQVQNRSVKLADIERQAVFLSDQEYVKTDKKSVDSIAELNFN
jgi:hypothetical protein